MKQALNSKIFSRFFSLFLVFVSATFFTWALPRVESLRSEHPWFLFGLPLLVIFVYVDRRRREDVLSTRNEIQALNSTAMSPTQLTRPVRFVAGLKQVFFTLSAHLFGASVGREAVGLQLGGWSARLRGIGGWFFGACLATGFAIVLGTPFAAAVFIFESRKWNFETKTWLLIVPIAWIAYRLSLLFGVEHHGYYPFSTTLPELLSIPWLTFAGFLVVLVLLSCAVGACFLLLNEKLASKMSAGKTSISLGATVAFLSLAVGLFYVYGFARAEELGLPGLGVSALKTLIVFDSSQAIAWFAHPLLIAVLKVVLTAGFVAVGIRGGELTPLLAAGALLAVGLGLVFGIPVSGLVAIGFPILWGIVARRPITAAILALEVFGFGGWGALGILVGLSAWCGIKLGDLFGPSLSNSFGLGLNKKPGVWRRGLYD